MFIFLVEHFFVKFFALPLGFSLFYFAFCLDGGVVMDGGGVVLFVFVLFNLVTDFLIHFVSERGVLKIVAFVFIIADCGVDVDGVVFCGGGSDGDDEF